MWYVLQVFSPSLSKSFDYSVCQYVFSLAVQNFYLNVVKFINLLFYASGF